MNNSDMIRLMHMLEAAREAFSFTVGKKIEDLNRDRMLVLSLVRCIEVIGEAASRVSMECRAECPDIPWQDIVDMRNRLIHTYFDINLDILWETATDELSPLISQLDKVLSEEELQ